MAKQRRARSKNHARKPSPARRTAARAPAPVQALSPLPPTPQRRATNDEAVALYEKGLEALQRRNFSLADHTLRAILDRYPEERELHERARLYLRICERETGPPPPPPKTLEERVYAATVALNAGRYDEALRELQAACEEDPTSDHAHYVLAVAFALRGDAPSAVSHLRTAIELNPENRVLARQESDFDAIRGYDGFRQALETPAQGPRRRGRGRSPR